eukprot:symbB.v1.2.040503.t1/scaffold7284.1/size12117/2
MTCKDLRKVSDLGREALLGTVQSAGDSEIDRGLFEATVKEVEKGFIEGPVERESLPAGSTLTKRFPVKQKNKVRPIDDYKASLVNYAVTQTEGDIMDIPSRSVEGSSRADFNAARTSAASFTSQNIDMGYPPIRSYTGALAETYSTYLGGGQRSLLTSSEPPPLSLTGLTTLSESLAAMQAPHESALERLRSVLHTAPKTGHHHSVRYAESGGHSGHAGTPSHGSKNPSHSQSGDPSHPNHPGHPGHPQGHVHPVAGHAGQAHNGHGKQIHGLKEGPSVHAFHGSNGVHGHAMSSTESVHPHGTPVSGHRRLHVNVKRDTGMSMDRCCWLGRRCIRCCCRRRRSCGRLPSLGDGFDGEAGSELAEVMLQATAVMDPGGLLSGARPESGDDWLPSWCRPQVARPASPEARAAQAEQECTVPRRRSTDGGSEELSLGTEHEACYCDAFLTFPASTVKQRLTSTFCGFG